MEAVNLLQNEVNSFKYCTLPVIVYLLKFVIFQIVMLFQIVTRIILNCCIFFDNFRSIRLKIYEVSGKANDVLL